MHRSGTPRSTTTRIVSKTPLLTSVVALSITKPTPGNPPHSSSASKATTSGLQVFPFLTGYKPHPPPPTETSSRPIVSPSIPVPASHPAPMETNSRPIVIPFIISSTISLDLVPIPSPPSTRKSHIPHHLPKTNTHPASPPPTTYKFNADSSTNIAVYYGQTTATSSLSLAQQCSDPNVDIVMLAFVTEKTALGSQYPAVNFGTACGGQMAKMESVAPGLLSCPELEADIWVCQAVYGKKVCLGSLKLSWRTCLFF